MQTPQNKTKKPVIPGQLMQYFCYILHLSQILILKRVTIQKNLVTAALNTNHLLYYQHTVFVK